MIDTPVNDAKRPGPQTVRAPTRLQSISTDLPWQQIFEYRFLLTTAGGEIRAVMNDRDHHVRAKRE